jgi:predicted lipase
LCTGHSLGAALALITGIEFTQKFPKIPVEVHNFGQPRVGNEILSRYMMSKISTIYRVVHNKDLVPHLPP